MATLIVRHHVRSFEDWKPGFDKHVVVRREAGITSHSVYRNADDPNDVTISLQCRNLNQARAFARSDELRKVMKEWGVEGTPQILFLERVEKTKY